MAHIRSIRKLTETGVLAYLRATWERKKPECIQSDLIIEPVDLKHFSSAMYVLSFGFSFGLIMLIIEILHHRYISSWCRSENKIVLLKK